MGDLFLLIVIVVFGVWATVGVYRMGTETHTKKRNKSLLHEIGYVSKKMRKAMQRVEYHRIWKRKK